MMTSLALPSRSAPMTPRKIPMTIQMIAAPMATDSVAGSPRSIWPQTLTCWV